MAHGPVVWWSGLFKRPHDSSTSAETAALHRMVRECRWLLKFVSYMQDPVGDVVMIPHICDAAPVLIQQDNTSTIACAHNPISHAAMKATLIKMSVIRDSLEGQETQPWETDTKDCIADMLTKQGPPADKRRLMPQLMGEVEWAAFAKVKDLLFKPGVCRHCLSRDLHTEMDEDKQRWYGLCNLCGTITWS